MKNLQGHIPFLKSITDFFDVYGIGKPFHPEIMCMKLEDQPDERLFYMPLYRANFYRVIHFSDSEIQSFTNGKKQEITKNCLVFSCPSKLESWERKGKLYGNVVYFSAKFADIDVTNRLYAEKYPFFSNESEHILPITESESLVLKKLSDEMIEEIYSDKEDKLELIKLLLDIYLHKIRRIYNQRIEKYSPQIKIDKSLFQCFKKEIDNYFLQLAEGKKDSIPSVSYFATLLNINPNNLNTSIKNQTGKTASSFIQDKMILEAKSYLIHTNLNIAQIALKLGFENTPYFNRFFKNHTTFTPLEYRNQLTNSSVL
ncbi:helix-turn-helix domain-containing protein [Arcicella lustrica]|uniref:AraC family transcriptional regulator n=1 Tax=Arcicella lustrica TaxID=2984196 RepID=A0ABU5SPQ4_9BACT|nr:AraC family transcriptional regulator [Arcicella sp. DC25W]MEA5429296.1 AraC family transcriptional regulator [Arcicella sp. DC25W]